MTPQHEETLRALRLADRDIAVFERIKDLPEIHLSMVLHAVPPFVQHIFAAKADQLNRGLNLRVEN